MSYRFEKIAEPTMVIFVKPLEPIDPALYLKGGTLALVSVRRNPIEALNPAMKASNLLNNALAAREAMAKGALEALMLNTRGEVAECAGSNVFIVKQGVLLTPPLSCGILEGITRAITLELAAALSLRLEERVISVEGVRSADEVFITSSLKEIVPIVRLDDASISGGVPGPMTKRLLAAYRERIAA